MGERKVLNKYYPPDFDPAKIPRRRQPKNQQMKVRMMLPMSIRCGTCGNYIYKGTKFNSRKEDVIGEVACFAFLFLPLSLFFLFSDCKAAFFIISLCKDGQIMCASVSLCNCSWLATLFKQIALEFYVNWHAI